MKVIAKCFKDEYSRQIECETCHSLLQVDKSDCYRSQMGTGSFTNCGATYNVAVVCPICGDTQIFSKSKMRMNNTVYNSLTRWPGRSEYDRFMKGIL